MIDDPERILGARGEQEIMPAHFVLDNAQHDVAAVGVEVVTFGEIKLAGIIQASA
jgi:hypothetical protein